MRLATENEGDGDEPLDDVLSSRLTDLLLDSVAEVRDTRENRTSRDE